MQRHKRLIGLAVALAGLVLAAPAQAAEPPKPTGPAAGEELKKRVRALIAALNDDSWLVRSNAAALLGQIGPAALDAVPWLHEVRALARQEWDGLDERAPGGFTLFVDDAYDWVDAMRLLQECCA